MKKSTSLDLGLSRSRCTFTSYRDARIFRGWVTEISQELMCVRCSTEFAMNIGDKYAFSVVGDGQDASFDCRLIGMDAIDLSTLRLQAHAEGPVRIESQNFHFELDGYIHYEPNQEPSRCLVDFLQVDVVAKSTKDVMESCTVTDISSDGIGVLVPYKVSRDMELTLRLVQGADKLAFDARVVYCRRSGRLYRVGLRITEISRIDNRRWQMLLERSRMEAA